MKPAVKSIETSRNKLGFRQNIQISEVPPIENHWPSVVFCKVFAFTKDSESEWFEHFLKARTFELKKMSPTEFLENF